MFFRPSRYVAGAARPAPLDQLWVLLMPAHFVLALLLLQPYFAPLEVESLMNPRFPRESSTPAWVVAAWFTALLASCPVYVGARRTARAPMWYVLGAALACGYVALMVCAVIRGAADGRPTFVAAAAVFGIPAALLCTLPFLLLDVPLLAVVRRYDERVTFEDHDRVLRSVGCHMLAVTGLTQVATAAWGAELWLTPEGLWVSRVLCIGGAALVLYGSARIGLRGRFVARVRAGRMPGYGVDSAPHPEQQEQQEHEEHQEHQEPLPRLSRGSAGTAVLVRLLPAPAEGAYRTATLRAPVALL